MNKLLLTSEVLDKLGFSEYWDENGDWGSRTLTFENGMRFRVIETDEMEDGNFGWISPAIYIANHYSFAAWFANPKIESEYNEDLYFLHQMYECIHKFYPSCIFEFIARCKKVNMFPYIDAYWKSSEKPPALAGGI